MMRTMLKSKIAGATVTDVQLYYKGSITIDEKIMKAADILPGERVDVLSVTTGSRLQTYVIPGEAGSGTICLNGPAARTAFKGDTIVIISYGIFDQKELSKVTARFVELDPKNHIVKQYSE